MNKKVFITYSWDTEEHKNWVRKIANHLIANGVVVLLDQYDILPGESFTHFMEASITTSNKVLVVMTPNYKNKSLERKGGVGYEQQIISGEIMAGIDRKKFIPLIRDGKYEDGDDCAVPPHFRGISTLDFRNSKNESKSLESLLRVIYEEPEFVKPILGTKPKFDDKNQIKSFTIELDEKFNCLQLENYLTDMFLQIYDLKVSNSEYDLSFNILGITNELDEYLKISEIQNPSENEINRKLQLRNYLNQIYFLNNGTLYEYLHYAINSIIDLSFIKYKYITNFNELYTSITKCLKLFSSENRWGNENIKFDVFHNKIKWGYSIGISENEVKNLLSKFSSKDRMILTAFAGLDTYDLSHLTIIENLIPKEAYQFTIDYFMKHINETEKEECFRIGNWRIGLG